MRYLNAEIWLSIATLGCQDIAGIICRLGHNGKVIV